MGLSLQGLNKNGKKMKCFFYFTLGSRIRVAFTIKNKTTVAPRCW
jgi:hypothetical protein